MAHSWALARRWAQPAEEQSGREEGCWGPAAAPANGGGCSWQTEPPGKGLQAERGRVGYSSGLRAWTPGRRLTSDLLWDLVSGSQSAHLEEGR